MNKKITSSALAALMIAGTTSFSAFASMASGTVVIGTKAFDINYVNDAAHVAEITNAILAGGTIYVKDFAGNWIDNVSGLKVDASKIPAVTYKSVAGVETKFDAMDKDAVNTLEVKSVSAINLKQVEVKFNKAVDAVEGAKLTNYFIGTSSTTNLATGTGATVALAADNMSAIVTLNDATGRLLNSTSTNYIKILKAVGFTADYVNTTVSVSDSVIPSVVSVKQSGPKTMDIVFSEPLNRAAGTAATVASFTLDAGTVTLDPSVATYNDSTRTLTIGTYTNLAAGEHTLLVKAPSNSALVDYAGYKVLGSSNVFTYVADVTAPIATLVSNTETSATIKFNKAVTNLVGNANVTLSHTYNSSAYQVLGTSVTNPSGDNMTFVVDFPINKPFVPGNSTLFLGYVSTTGTLIADNYGNTLGSTSFTLNTVVDTVKPTITTAVFTNATTLTLTFSEQLETATAQTAANYTLKDSAGDAVVVNNAVLDGTKKIVTLTTATMGGGAYVLTTKAVKDASIAGNVMADATIAIAATDTIAPTVVDKVVGGPVSVNQVAINKVKVEFSEAMDPILLADKANWNYNSAALLTGDTVTVASDNKSVIITTVANIDASKDLTLGHVKDLAGNYIALFSTTLDIVPTSTIPATTVTSTGKNTVAVAFDQMISGAVASDFEVSLNGGGLFVPVTGFGGVTTVDGKTTIIVLTPDQTNSTGAGVQIRTVSAVGVAGAALSAKNDFGTAVQMVANTPVTVDGYLPTLTTATNMTTMDVDNNGQIDHIKLTFSEAMNAGYISADKFTVTGYTVIGAAAGTAPTTATMNATTVGNNADVYVTVKEGTTTDLTAVPTITIGTGLKDVAGNSYAGLATATITVNGVASARSAAATIAVNAYNGLALTTVAEVGTAVTNAGTAATTAIASAVAAGVTDTFTATVAAKTVAVNAEKAKITALTGAVTVAQAHHNALVEGVAQGQVAVGSKATYQTAITNASTLATTPASTIVNVVNGLTTLNTATADIDATLVP